MLPTEHTENIPVLDRMQTGPFILADPLAEPLSSVFPVNVNMETVHVRAHAHFASLYVKRHVHPSCS